MLLFSCLQVWTEHVGRPTCWCLMVVHLLYYRKAPSRHALPHLLRMIYLASRDLLASKSSASNANGEPANGEPVSKMARAKGFLLVQTCVHMHFCVVGFAKTFPAGVP